MRQEKNDQKDVSSKRSGNRIVKFVKENVAKSLHQASRMDHAEELP